VNRKTRTWIAAPVIVLAFGLFILAERILEGSNYEETLR